MTTGLRLGAVKSVIKKVLQIVEIFRDTLDDKWKHLEFIRKKNLQWIKAINWIEKVQWKILASKVQVKLQDKVGYNLFQLSSKTLKTNMGVVT